MSDYAAVISAGLSGQAGSSGLRHTLAGRSVNVTGGLDLPAQAVTAIHVPSAAAFAALSATPAIPAPLSNDWDAEIVPGIQEHWFEKMHSFPQFFELGNILTSLTRDIEIYNAFRYTSREMQSATNNAGNGISFLGLPSLPYDLPPQVGLSFEVRVTTSGPPDIDGTLDFVFDLWTISMYIVGTRVVMFSYQPESPVGEMLEFQTGIVTSANGKEQRRHNRRFPRQRIDMNVKVEEGSARRKLQTLLFGWQSGTFGVPIWWEARKPTADITAGDLTVNVSTLYGDFRSESLAIIWQDEETYDALEIQSLTDDTITFSSPATRSYDASAVLIMPLRVAKTESRLQIDRHPVSLDELRIEFLVTDNQADIGDTSAFPEYDGKVLLNEGNMLLSSSTLPVVLDRRIDRIDNELAEPIHFSDWLGPQIVTQKGFYSGSAQRTWEVRQLVHALRGSQITFYLPTFYYDMVIAADITTGSSYLDIEHIDYSTYINGQAPNAHIEVELADGTLYHKQITEATELTTEIERLTLSEAWADDISMDDVVRISYLHLVRIEGDRVQFQHLDPNQAQIGMAVRGVSQ